jgi:hypothetical protein
MRTHFHLGSSDGIVAKEPKPVSTLDHQQYTWVAALQLYNLKEDSHRSWGPQVACPHLLFKRSKLRLRFCACCRVVWLRCNRRIQRSFGEFHYPLEAAANVQGALAHSEALSTALYTTYFCCRSRLGSKDDRSRSALLALETSLEQIFNVALALTLAGVRAVALSVRSTCVPCSCVHVLESSAAVELRTRIVRDLFWYLLCAELLDVGETCAT